MTNGEKIFIENTWNLIPNRESHCPCYAFSMTLSGGIRINCNVQKKNLGNSVR